ncbi:ANL_HP_G0201650.mRNA.1.CDS.1 [Saccharomyces cerevisiae]|nr:ANL_HP_G0201650.mRNA.1.CDS.1 [Saccharomyces cerevisiae]CAI6476571.1 ANL_HP_G0201650.mRNA.1.CDS.1 [Saccharomyces cerevisiae]
MNSGSLKIAELKEEISTKITALQRRQVSIINGSNNSIGEQTQSKRLPVGAQGRRIEKQTISYKKISG